MIIKILKLKLNNRKNLQILLLKYWNDILKIGAKTFKMTDNVNNWFANVLESMTRSTRRYTV